MFEISQEHTLISKRIGAIGSRGILNNICYRNIYNITCRKGSASDSVLQRIINIMLPDLTAYRGCRKSRRTHLGFRPHMQHLLWCR
jgi:hypothetical protein